ncbi:TVP38/TMEM64 family protein [Aphanothece sacrum]|uniref:TVP38/TMEM64 family membrane protein n=1 Tax=Aphanothece sacrum FPU1 TaxID=1920663 RepID=A0A401IJC6_APHSA|nr:TVP38/TMEM64 family protein [Aphanothece sacrum]GBF81398.1 membrane protein [Aphanothece sacrum FPU1]GBF85410.1 membrane protein [Aphanothece sacrum FPU3]
MKTTHKYRFYVQRKYQIFIIFFLLTLLIIWWGHNSFNSHLFTSEGLHNILTKSGWLAPFIYIIFLVISVVISQIPAIPLVMAAGMVWNPPLATIYSVIGGFLGGLLAYYLGRTLGRNGIKALTGKMFYISKDRGEIYLGFLIFMTRLIPLFSFDLISYASGFAGISLPIYAISTLFGMIPPTFLLTYMGSSLTLDFYQKLNIMSFLLLSTLIFAWLIHRYNFLGLKNLIHVE